MRRQSRKGKKGGSVASALSVQERHCMIAETAYFIAERRGFQDDLALADWLQAETDTKARLQGTG